VIEVQLGRLMAPRQNCVKYILRKLRPERWCVLCEEWVTPLSDGKGCPGCWSHTMSKEEKDACEQGM
jgi:hypothetical protein